MLNVPISIKKEKIPKTLTPENTPDSSKHIQSYE